MYFCDQLLFWYLNFNYLRFIILQDRLNNFTLIYMTNNSSNNVNYILNSFTLLSITNNYLNNINYNKYIINIFVKYTEITIIIIMRFYFISSF